MDFLENTVFGNIIGIISLIMTIWTFWKTNRVNKTVEEIQLQARSEVLLSNYKPKAIESLNEILDTIRTDFFVSRSDVIEIYRIFSKTLSISESLRKEDISYLKDAEKFARNLQPCGESEQINELAVYITNIINILERK